MTHIQNIPANYNNMSNGWTKHSKTMKLLRSSCNINVSRESYSLKNIVSSFLLRKRFLLSMHHSQWSVVVPNACTPPSGLVWQNLRAILFGESFSTWRWGWGELPHLLVVWFKAKRNSFLKPGMAPLVVDVEEGIGDCQDGKHQSQGTHCKEKFYIFYQVFLY